MRNVNKEKHLGVKASSFLIFLFLIFHFSLFICSCENPLVIKILDPKTASFVTNGGGRIESQTVYRDYPIKRPANPLRSGYTFDAWYVDNNIFEKKWDFDTIPTTDMTLYAKWNGDEYDEYTVTFVYNDGVTANETLTVTHGSTIDEPDKPTRTHNPREYGLYQNAVPTNYTFGGWFTESACTNEWDFDTEVTENRILYAKWTLLSKISLNYAQGNFISEAINYVNQHGANSEYILLNGSNNILAQKTQEITAANLKLTIEGIDGSSRISPAAGVSTIFNINAGGTTLTLGNNITLGGRDAEQPSSGIASLIFVTNGTLVMNEGSKITWHTNTGTDGGGGVKVNGGTFIMNGGIISNNTSTYGGGVYVGSGNFTMNGGTIGNNRAVPHVQYGGGGGGGVGVGGGTFTLSGSGTISGNKADYAAGVYVSGTFNMNGGTISGNEAASSAGGGVYVNSSGTFGISDGIVHGTNENDTSLRNTAIQGAALYVSTTDGDGTAQYGNVGGHWTSIGTTGSDANGRWRENTIEVEYGVLKL